VRTGRGSALEILEAITRSIGEDRTAISGHPWVLCTVNTNFLGDPPFGVLEADISDRMRWTTKTDIRIPCSEDKGTLPKHFAFLDAVESSVHGTGRSR